MWSNMVGSSHTTLLYVVFAPAAFTLCLLAGTYVFTSLRYQVGLWQNPVGIGKTRSPTKLPYTIPFLGNTFSFLSLKPGSFWNKLFTWHPRTTGACTLKMGGKSTHVLYDPHAIQALFQARDLTRDTLTFDVTSKGFGLGPTEAHHFLGHSEPASERLGGLTPRAAREHKWATTLLRADRVNELMVKFAELLQQELSSELQGDSKSVEVSLYSWIRKHMFKASTITFMGTTCLQDYPDLEQDFFDYDANFLTCYFGIPRWLAPKIYAVRDRLTQKLLHWKEQDLERTKGAIVDPEGDVIWDPIHGSRANRACQVYYEIRGMNTQSRALLDLGFIFGISSNAIPTTGWMLMHILNPVGDKTLYPRIMDEINACKRPDGSFDMPALMNQPLLLSTLHEVLRLYVDTLVTRELPRDTILPLGSGNDKLLLRKDSLVMAPTWVAHNDSSNWHHPPAGTFLAERFLTTDADTGKQIFSTAGTAGKLFPFGGGKTMCPGRMFAKQEVLGSIALILSEFEVEALGFLDDKGRKSDIFPTPRDAYPGSAAVVMKGDVKVRITRRGP